MKGEITHFCGNGRTSPFSGLTETLPCHRQHIKIRARKHGIQPVFVFHQAPVSGFRVAELAFDDTKNVLHFASHRGFAMFDETLPINGVVGNLGQAVRTAIDAVVDSE